MYLTVMLVMVAIATTTEAAASVPEKEEMLSELQNSAKYEDVDLKGTGQKIQSLAEYEEKHLKEEMDKSKTNSFMDILAHISELYNTGKKCRQCM